MGLSSEGVLTCLTFLLGLSPFSYKPKHSGMSLPPDSVYWRTSSTLHRGCNLRLVRNADFASPRCTFYLASTLWPIRSQENIPFIHHLEGTGWVISNSIQRETVNGYPGLTLSAPRVARIFLFKVCLVYYVKNIKYSCYYIV